ncbi:hypothetical protein BJ508DRAFT_340974 [Ascobolus immersus RN42]|uniref:Uncharacterized protein n=1 Tax=Ascobolus immersus RN42 TaxID=1160509 RepID=A0A3N4HMH2_ASCIM|nr:hypothetical protein BJ508DRAFT_340974 [Ascobolus immersus RN42]
MPPKSKRSIPASGLPLQTRIRRLQTKQREFLIRRSLLTAREHNGIEELKRVFPTSSHLFQCLYTLFTPPPVFSKDITIGNVAFHEADLKRLEDGMDFTRKVLRAIEQTITIFEKNPNMTMEQFGEIVKGAEMGEIHEQAAEMLNSGWFGRFQGTFGKK